MAQRTHPHAEATYRVVPSGDGAFAVEVDIPESYPTKVSPSATKPPLRRGSPNTGGGCSLKTSRAAGFAVRVPAEPRRGCAIRRGRVGFGASLFTLQSIQKPI